MNTQEMPTKNQEQPSSEERAVPMEMQESNQSPLSAVYTHEQDEVPMTSVPPAIHTDEQYSVQTIPPHYIPAVQSASWPHSPTGVQPATWSPKPYNQTRRSRWPWLVLTFLLLFMFLIGGTMLLFFVAGSNFTGNTQSITESRQFVVSANPTLVLNNDTGSIHVHAAKSGTAVIIRATKHSGPLGNLNDISVSYTQNQQANTITVNVDRLNNATSFNSASVDFEATVPATAALQLKTNTGSIDVNGVSGQIVLVSNTGSLEASNGMASDNTSLTTNTGSVTFNGEIASSGTYHFETNTGSVNVTLLAESTFHVDASTDTGAINTNFPGVMVQQHQFTRAEAHGDVGSAPRTMVSLRTNTGSINLFHR